jgi:hypothetical protein
MNYPILMLFLIAASSLAFGQGTNMTVKCLKFQSGGQLCAPPTGGGASSGLSGAVLYDLSNVVSKQIPSSDVNKLITTFTQSSTQTTSSLILPHLTANGIIGIRNFTHGKFSPNMTTNDGSFIDFDTNFTVPGGRGTLFFYNVADTSWHTLDLLSTQPPYAGVFLGTVQVANSTIEQNHLYEYDDFTNQTQTPSGFIDSVPDQLVTPGAMSIVGIINHTSFPFTLHAGFFDEGKFNEFNLTSDPNLNLGQPSPITIPSGNTALFYSSDGLNWIQFSPTPTSTQSVMLQSAAVIPPGASTVTIPPNQLFNIGQGDFGASAVALQLDASLSGSSIAVGQTCDPTPRILVITARPQGGDPTGTNLVIVTSPAPDPSSTMPICFTMQWPSRPLDSIGHVLTSNPRDGTGAARSTGNPACVGFSCLQAGQ